MLFQLTDKLFILRFQIVASKFDIILIIFSLLAEFILISLLCYQCSEILLPKVKAAQGTAKIKHS
jgi:hypothetical protein